MDNAGEPPLPNRSEHGGTAVEYGLMVAFIGAAIVATLLLFGGKVDGLFESICGGSNPFNC